MTTLSAPAAFAAIASYLSWLKKNDLSIIENVEDDGKIELVVKERLAAPDRQVGPRFEADLAPPDDREIDNALNVAATARAQLIELYDEVLPAYRSSALKPDEWSLTQHLRHILETEAYFIACLSDQSPETIPVVAEADLTMKLFENAMDYETFLRDLPPEQRARVYHQGEAEYTAAKVLRRMCEHLREHYPWMLAISRQFSTHPLTGPEA